MIAALMSDALLLHAARQLRPDREDPVETIARIAWNTMTEPGDGVAGVLIERLGAAEALRVACDERGLTEKTLHEARKRWMPRARPAAVHDALRGALEAGSALLLPGDAAWPTAVDDLAEHAPTALWMRGDPAILNMRQRASIVGARAATAYGDRVAAELAGDLAMGGAAVISGGAYGIDGSAHRAALGVGGATVAVLAGGVDRAYPAGHQQLFDQIRSSGVVLSELPCGAAPTKWRFLSRNRIIAALGQATVVVEAGWRSGSLNTAGHASSLGRPLGAVPGPITSAASAGCHRLLREYDAHCVTSAEEVRELMGAGAACQGGPSFAEDREEPDTVRVLDALSRRVAHPPAEIAARSGLAVDRVRGILGLLGLDGRAAQSAEGWRRA
ncbi:DNA-processing protein DprA [uncultured Microbacterium sp.]|uniref:DNA-processing protein DprA n=1 Tax=uncultured Microbacterium sp. TaxID=191216 RepID=UPI00262E4972|nr:DNA-processing protein DprA [uncultured Microbacterium sp.]